MTPTTATTANGNSPRDFLGIIVENLSQKNPLGYCLAGLGLFSSQPNYQDN